LLQIPFFGKKITFKQDKTIVFGEGVATLMLIGYNCKKFLK
jgi:hypothetical protein